MILALDSYYSSDKSTTVGIEFTNWIDEVEHNVYTQVLEGVEEYKSGEFL